MRIIHVIPALTKGGGEKVAVDLANMAHQHGDDVSFVVGWAVDPTFLQNSIHPSIPIRFIGADKNQAFLKMPWWIFSNRKFLLTTDVIHCHLTYSSFFACLIYFLKKIIRKKKPVVIATNHSVGMGIPNFKRWINAKMFSVKDGVVFMALDDYWKRFIEKEKKMNLTVIPNGVAVPSEKDIKQEKSGFFAQTGVPNTCKYLVGTIGVLRPDRNPGLYLPLFEHIYQELGSDVHFVMGGAGSEFENLKNALQGKRYASNFHMIGLVNKPFEILHNLDAYVSLSVGNITGISMIEAAMSGVPVVGIQLLPAHVLGAKDWVWSSSDLNLVAQKITSLYENPDKRKQYMAHQQQHVFSHFTAENMYTSYKAFYQKLLNQ